MHLRTGLMLSLAGDVRCEGCALIDNMRAGAELNRMAAPYGTTGTYNTIIGINSPAMAGRNFPHFVRDDPDAPQTYGWCAPATHTSCNECIHLCLTEWSPETANDGDERVAKADALTCTEPA